MFVQMHVVARELINQLHAIITAKIVSKIVYVLEIPSEIPDRGTVDDNWLLTVRL